MLEEGAHALVVQAVKHLVVVGRQDDGGRLDLVRQAHDRLRASARAALTSSAPRRGHMLWAEPTNLGEKAPEALQRRRAAKTHIMHNHSIIRTYLFIDASRIPPCPACGRQRHADGGTAYCLQPVERAKGGRASPGWLSAVGLRRMSTTVVTFAATSCGTRCSWMNALAASSCGAGAGNWAANSETEP